MSNDIRYDSRVEWMYYHGEKTVCIVNEYGNIWNIKTGTLYSHTKDEVNDDCVYIPIKGIERHARIKISYAVARAFIPNPYDFNYVNHKDGNIDNHHVSNLEWSFSRIKSIKNPYTDSELHKICGLLEKNYTDIQIANQLGYHINFLGYIKRVIPDKWNEISSQYNIKRRPYRKNSESDIHLVCRMLEDGRSTFDIAKKTGVDVTIISRIKGGELWTHVSSLYCIPKPNKEYSIFVTRKKEIVEAIESGITKREDIMSLLDIPDTKQNRGAISRIKHQLKKEKVQRLSQ
jgi:hypothetical protein